MPRYYFDTLDGEAMIDQDGEMAPDNRSARDIATKIVSEMTPGKAPHIWAGEPFKVVLRDEGGKTIGTLTVTATRRSDDA
ncbi:DUF6894 family protein [Brevundimonas sp.]